MTDTDLRTRILTARALAEAATPGPWEWDDDGRIYTTDEPWVKPEIARSFTSNTATAEHIAANDPASRITACNADLDLLNGLTHDGWCSTTHNECCGPRNCDCLVEAVLANLNARYPE